MSPVLRGTSVLALQASAAQTATGNGAGVETGEYKEALVTLNVTAASGTSPTCTVKLQTSDDGGTTWYDLPNAAFTAATAVTRQAIQVSIFGNLIRAAWTIGGTTPSFTFTVNALCK